MLFAIKKYKYLRNIRIYFELISSEVPGNLLYTGTRNSVREIYIIFHVFNVLRLPIPADN